jgi:DNA-binding GntR family transcriptional regulator
MPDLENAQAIDVTDDTTDITDEDLPDLRPIAAPRKLAEDASDLLRDQILSGNLRRGTHLVEAKLAARLNVSRGTIREAFKILIADGLVREEPRRGAFVVTLSRTDVREIYDVRAAIEGRAAYLLAAHRDAHLLEPLVQTIDAIASAARDRDMATLRRQDLAFHAQICVASGNRRLVEVFNRYVPVVQTLLTYDELVYASPDDIAEEHRVILEAIQSGDPEKAASAVAGHCERARDKVSAYFEDAPET